MATRWQQIGGGVITTAVMCAVVWWCLGPEAGLSRWLARSWARDLSHGSAEQVAGDLRYIAAMDEAGLGTLLDALGNSRKVISESAAQALHERIEVWRRWPHERSGPLATQLAQGLARRIDGWPTASRRVAADVALQLLNWPIDPQQGSRAELLVDCERILRNVPAVSTSIQGESAATESEAKPRETHESGSQPGLLTSSSGFVEIAERQQDANTQPPDVDAGLEIQPAVTRQADAFPTHPSVDLQTPRAFVTDESMPASESGPDRSPTASGTDAALPVESVNEHLSPLSKRPILELMHDLGHPNPEIAMQAETELERRGFREYEFKLAYKLIHPDPAERRQVARLVHGLPSGAGHWLIWLSQDPDRSVRQAAVSLMVTAQDPLVQRRLLKMEVTDGDESICERIREWRERR